jgi:hypothetical protein
VLLSLKIALLATGFAAVLIWLPAREEPNRFPVGLDVSQEVTRAPRELPAPRSDPAPVSTSDAPSAGELVALTATHFYSSASAPLSNQRLGSTKPADAETRQELVRRLQRELGRVGCYGGEADGDWGPGSKRAMSAFLGRVNASLPVAEPDYILLALLQNRSVTCDDRAGKAALAGDADESPLDFGDNSAPSARAASQPDRAPLNRSATASRSSFTPVYERSWRERVFER